LAAAAGKSAALGGAKGDEPSALLGVIIRWRSFLLLKISHDISSQVLYSLSTEQNKPPEHTVVRKILYRRAASPSFYTPCTFFLRNSFSAAYNPNAIKIGFFHYDTGIEGKEQRFKVSFLAVIPSSLGLSRRILSAAESLRERIINKVVCVCVCVPLRCCNLSSF